MYKALTALLAIAFLATAANGQTTLNLTVKACDGSGSSDVTVAPGGSLDYAVVGELGDSATQGLATVGFDLVLHDDAVPPAIAAVGLPRADPPTSLPMLNLAFPLGLNNPTGGVLDSAVGYGGTLSRGKLLQCGGAQNTILNTSGTFLLAPSPILNVAQPGSPEVLLTGTLTAPAVVGDYTLAIKATCVRIDPTQAALSSDALCTTDLDCADGDADPLNDEVCKGHPFAMLIDQDLTTHFSVVSAVIPEPIHLTIHVVAGAADPCAAPLCLDPAGANDPSRNAIDAGIAHAIDNTTTKKTLQTITLVFTGDAAGLVPADFTVTQKVGGGTEEPGPGVDIVNGSGNTAQITFVAPLTPGAWTKVSLGCGVDYCIGSMPGDTNQDRDATAADIDALIACLNNGTCGALKCDIDRLGACTGADLATLIDVLNNAGTFTSFTALGPSPCP